MNTIDKFLERRSQFKPPPPTSIPFTGNLDQDFRQAVEIYTDDTVRDLKVAPDPATQGTYALQATMEDNRTLQFQYEGGLDPNINLQKLQHTTFPTWPPHQY